MANSASEGSRDRPAGEEAGPHAQHRRRAERQRGQVLVIFALLLPVLVAMLAILIDGGIAYGQRRSAQNAADAGALAAVLAAGSTGSCDASQSGSADALAGKNGAGIPTVTFTWVSALTPPGAGHALPVCQATVNANVSHAPYLSGIVGRTSLQAGAAATAAVAGLASYTNTPSGFAPLLPIAIDLSSFTSFGFSPTVQQFAVTAAPPNGFFWFLPAGSSASCSDPTILNYVTTADPTLRVAAGDAIQTCPVERPDALDALSARAPVLRTVALTKTSGGTTTVQGFALLSVEAAEHGTGIVSSIYGYFVNTNTPTPGSIGAGLTPNYGMYNVGLVQ